MLFYCQSVVLHLCVITNNSIGYLRLILIKVVSGAQVVLTLEQSALVHTWPSMQCERQPPCLSPSLLCYCFSPRPTCRTTHESSFSGPTCPSFFYILRWLRTERLPFLCHITTSPHLHMLFTLPHLMSPLCCWSCTLPRPRFYVLPFYHVSTSQTVATLPHLQVYFYVVSLPCFHSSTPQFSINI